MKPLSKDIIFTLMIKIFLLVLLWCICFKSIEKKTLPTEQWLLGDDIKR